MHGKANEGRRGHLSSSYYRLIDLVEVKMKSSGGIPVDKRWRILKVHQRVETCRLAGVYDANQSSARRWAIRRDAKPG
jgi:hypothetical protein